MTQNYIKFEQCEVAILIFHSKLEKILCCYFCIQYNIEYGVHLYSLYYFISFLSLIAFCFLILFGNSAVIPVSSQCNSRSFVRKRKRATSSCRGMLISSMPGISESQFKVILLNVLSL